MTQPMACSGHTFYGVSAPAGSGKTFALGHYAVDLAHNNQKVLIVQPTKNLIRETWNAARRIDLTLPMTTIVSASLGQSHVLADVVAHMANAEHGKGEILFVSHDVLGRLPKAYRQFWHVFVDEMPSGFTPHHLKIAVTHRHATDHLVADRPLTGGIVAVDAVDENALKTLASNPHGDTGLSVFKELASDVLNPDKLVLVNKANYDNLVDPMTVEKITSFFSILQPSFLDDFASVTIMGANLDSTELYMLWEKLLNVTWKPHPVLSQNLRYNQHENGSRLTIKYLIEGNWSKDFAQKPFGGGIVLDEVTRLMEDELGTDFLWQANKSIDDNQFEEGVRLPTKAHGQNRKAFVRSDKVALVMAINHTKAASDFLKLINFTQAEIKTVLQYQNEYQALMRCSLRVPNATNPVTVCVVSKGSADWLAARFPGCTVSRLANDLPEPGAIGAPKKKHKKSRAEVQKDYRERAKAKQVAAESGAHLKLLAAAKRIDNK